MKLTYYRDLQAYGDGTFLYVSQTGIVKSWWGIGTDGVRSLLRRYKPDLVIEHWGGAASGELRLYRRHVIRALMHSVQPTRGALSHMVLGTDEVAA